MGKSNVFPSALMIGLVLFLFSSAGWNENARKHLQDLFQTESAGEYTFSTSSGVYNEITAGVISSASGDDGAENISLPFPFIYDSLVFNTARISVNGWLELGQGFNGPGYANDLASQVYRPLLAPFWDDLYDDTTSEIRYETQGSSPNRIFVVQWKGIRWPGSTGTRQNFQVRLYEGTNLIEFIYGPLANSTNTSASIGLNDSIGGTGHFLSVTPASPPTISTTTANNNINSVNYLPSGTVYQFHPPCFHLWEGAVSQDWFDTGNWNCGVLPGSSSNASILAGSSYFPHLTADVNLGVLGIENGAKMLLEGGNLALYSILIEGELEVTGNEVITISGTNQAWYRHPASGIFKHGNGRVIFTGTGTATLNSPVTFYNAQIDPGKSFDPGENSMVVNGEFINHGTFWASQEISLGNEFYGTVQNSGTWKGRQGPMTFYNSFTNNAGATFNASNDVGKGTDFYQQMLNEGTFNASDGGLLIARGDWNNNGVFVPGSGQVTFMGNGTQIIRSDSGLNEFFKVVVENGSQVNLENMVQVFQDLEIKKGAVINLGRTNLVVEGTLSNWGTISQEQMVNAGINVSFMEIGNTSGSVIVYRGVEILAEGDLGITTVKIRGNQDLCNNTDELIHRCFEIQPTTANNAQVRFWYLETEKGLENPDLMKAYHWNGSTWEELNLAATPRGSVGNYHWVEAIGINHYSYFGLADDHPGDPTDFRLDYFQAKVGVGRFFSMAGLLIIFSVLSIVWLMSKRIRG